MHVSCGVSWCYARKGGFAVNMEAHCAVLIKRQMALLKTHLPWRCVTYVTDNLLYFLHLQRFLILPVRLEPWTTSVLLLSLMLVYLAQEERSFFLAILLPCQPLGEFVIRNDTNYMLTVRLLILFPPYMKGVGRVEKGGNTYQGELPTSASFPCTTLPPL